MSICPMDGKPCMDDLCRGGGCLLAGGIPMLEPCRVCGVPTDGEFVECACDPAELDHADGDVTP